MSDDSIFYRYNIAKFFSVNCWRRAENIETKEIHKTLKKYFINIDYKLLVNLKNVNNSTAL